MASDINQSTVGATSTDIEGGDSSNIVVGEPVLGSRSAETRENLPEVIVDVVSLEKNKLKFGEKEEDLRREEYGNEVEEVKIE